MKYTWGIKNYDDILQSLGLLKNNIENEKKYENMMKNDLKETHKRKIEK